MGWAIKSVSQIYPKVQFPDGVVEYVDDKEVEENRSQTAPLLYAVIDVEWL